MQEVPGDIFRLQRETDFRFSSQHCKFLSMQEDLGDILRLQRETDFNFSTQHCNF